MDIVQQSACMVIKVSKAAKIRNQYNQVPHLTQGTNGKVTYSQPDTTNESQEVSPFPAGKPSYNYLFDCTTEGQTSDSMMTGVCLMLIFGWVHRGSF